MSQLAPVIGVAILLFATTNVDDLFVLVFLLMTGVWCLVGHALVTQPRRGPAIRRVAAPLTPFVV